MEEQTKQMNSILVWLFWRYLEMIEDADNEILEDKYNLMSMAIVGRDLAADNKLTIDKGNRWIGYIQGILIAHDITTIQIERDYTRELFQKYYKDFNMDIISVDLKQA